MKILLIEDDQRLARLIARVLRDEHYQSTSSTTGRRGWSKRCTASTR